MSSTPWVCVGYLNPYRGKGLAQRPFPRMFPQPHLPHHQTNHCSDVYPAQIRFASSNFCFCCSFICLHGLVAFAVSVLFLTFDYKIFKHPVKWKNLLDWPFYHSKTSFSVVPIFVFSLLSDLSMNTRLSWLLFVWSFPILYSQPIHVFEASRMADSSALPSKHFDELTGGPNCYESPSVTRVIKHGVGSSRGDWPGNDSSLGMSLWKSSRSVLLPPHWERRLLPRPQLSWRVGHRTRLSWNHSSSCAYWVSWFSWLKTLGCCKPLVNFWSSKKVSSISANFSIYVVSFQRSLLHHSCCPFHSLMSIFMGLCFLCPREMPRREITGSQGR